MTWYLDQIVGTGYVSGYSGYSGVGSSGSSGYSGYSGAPGDNTLIWTAAGNQRILTSFTDPDNNTSNVRSVSLQDNLLTLVLAEFTPSFTATMQPSGSLSWDVAATGFGVNVDNPGDFTSKYISNVKNITASVGTISSLGSFTTAGPTPTPAGGVDWTQSFTTNGGSYLRPISSTIAGGSVTGTVNFYQWDGSSQVNYTESSATLTATWATPTLAIALNSLTGQTFLGTYSSTPYTVTITGMNSAANYANAVTGTGGSVSSATGSGTFTFTTAVHKDNTGTSRSVGVTTTFTRPIDVTGTLYTAQLTTSGNIPSISFTYPTLWVWTVGTSFAPTRSSFISGSSFAAGVTELGNQVKTFAAYVSNSDPSPKAFWFAVRTSASQPTVFKTGPSPSLLSDVAVTTGNTVNLAPDSPPSGYVNEGYTLYGIVLQPGSTYVSIS